MHVSVLKKEVLEYLRPVVGMTIVDATFGAGGHAAAILEKLGSTKEGGRLIGIDRDPAAIDVATHRFKKEIDSGQLLLVQARFSELANVLQDLGREKVDGILMDFGVSSEQLLSPTRGLSFQYTAPLDMRLDPREDFTAARLLKEWPEHELRSLFFSVGEKSYAGRIARAIVRRRGEGKIETTDQLVEVIKSAIPAPVRAKRHLHSATKVFLGLRIAVNHELEEIERGLKAALPALEPGGRLVAISFQSLEDQIVKQTFRSWASDCVCPPDLPICVCKHRSMVKILTRQPIVPSASESSSNARARSAKLRAVERL
jgi:16S rRNA (cytosine1402-N4)-methyltransferase